MKTICVRLLILARKMLQCTFYVIRHTLYVIRAYLTVFEKSDLPRSPQIRDCSCSPGHLTKE